MAWRLSTGFKKKLLGGNPEIDENLVSSTVSFGDGNGTGGTDTIADSANGLGDFKRHDFILIIGGLNNNVFTKVLTATTAVLEVSSGSFVAAAVGTAIAVLKISSSSMEGVMANGTMVGYDQPRPASADDAEVGNILIRFTLNADSFVAGLSANGINLGAFSGDILTPAIDPETSAPEVWAGQGVADGTIRTIRWYDNAVITGSSVDAVRLDGVVATSGGDVNTSTGTTIVTGATSVITEFNTTLSAA